MRSRTTIIKKDHHHPDWWWVPVPVYKPKGIEIEIFVDPSMCTGSQHHTNKVKGISRGHHHQNSVRLGWLSKGDHVEFRRYYYVNGERKDQYLKSGYKGGWYKFVLLIEDAPNMKSWGYILNPYHGAGLPFVSFTCSNCLAITSDDAETPFVN